ncbi:MAG: C-type lectin domain-containing protein, partial [Acidaminococcaceae bacterium]|nr:C-type lectin domain-containing protein [Acidaminococcaceae bacterium]
EVIHSTYAAEPASVIYYAEDSTRPFIPKEAIKYKGHHYHVFSDIGKTMEEAQQFCESMGGHLAAVGDDEMNERMYRLINDSGYDNEYFEKFGHYRMIPNEPVTYVKANQESNLEEDEVFYGLYYWNYKNLTEDGTTDGTGGNAFVCEWDK